MDSVVPKELGVSLLDMKITRLAFYALAFGPTSATHADFSWELAGDLGYADRSDDRGLGESFGEDVSSNLLSVSATHYFDPVEEGSVPLALAAFFDPSSELSVALGQQQTSGELYTSGNTGGTTHIDDDVSDYSLRGLYLFAESKWFAGGRYARLDGDARSNRSNITGTSSGTTSDDRQDYALFAGKYFGTGATRLELSLAQSTEESAASSTSCSFSGFCSTFDHSSEVTLESSSLAVMHVRQFRAATYALLGKITEERFRDGTFDGIPLPDLGQDQPRTYFVGADLYPVPTVGVRLGYELVDWSGAEEHSVTIGASWFVRRNVGLDLTLSSEDTDFNSAFVENPASTNRVALRVIGRL